MSEYSTSRFKHLAAGIGIVVLASAAIYGYYHHNEVYPSTDNAYVNANLVNIAPKVGGYVHQVLVSENQLVHKGDLLVTIDPQDYQLQLTKARQDLSLAQQQAATAKVQIATAKANLAKAQSDFAFANQLSQRYTKLYAAKAGSLQDVQKYQNQANQAKEAVSQAKASVEQATSQFEAAQTQIAIANTNVKNAQNNTGYTELRSPVDGYVSNVNLQTGELVASGQKLFGIVDNSVWWIDANFKETQLKRIKAGQPVTITLDMYNHEYKGSVQSISYASGNTFSLLPAENATGNWVKVTQRFTVKVKLDNDPQFPLRVGASSKVSVDTTK